MWYKALIALGSNLGRVLSTHQFIFKFLFTCSRNWFFFVFSLKKSPHLYMGVQALLNNKMSISSPHFTWSFYQLVRWFTGGNTTISERLGRITAHNEKLVSQNFTFLGWAISLNQGLCVSSQLKSHMWSMKRGVQRASAVCKTQCLLRGPHVTSHCLWRF